MKDMYYQGIVPHECGHEHPEWTEYPHPGHPPVSYYMTAYDIAVKNGYTGTEEDWLASLKGETGMTAFELYVKNTGYTGTEAEWNTMVNAAKTEAVAAKDAAVIAKNAAVAAKDATEEMLGDIPDGYADVCGKLQGLMRRVAAHSAAIIKSVPKDGLFYKWYYDNATDVPDIDSYTDEVHIQFTKAITSADANIPKVPGILECYRGVSTNVPAVQYFYPLGNKTDHSHDWEIWFRPRYVKSNGSLAWGTFRCINGVDETLLPWEVTE